MSNTSNTIIKNINGEFKIEYGDPYREEIYTYPYLNVSVSYLYSDPKETICFQIYIPGVYISGKSSISAYQFASIANSCIDKLTSILSCTLEDLALHINDPEGLDQLVYWRYSLTPTVLKSLHCTLTL